MGSPFRIVNLTVRKYQLEPAINSQIHSVIFELNAF